MAASRRLNIAPEENELLRAVSTPEYVRVLDKVVSGLVGDLERDVLTCSSVDEKELLRRKCMAEGAAKLAVALGRCLNSLRVKNDLEH